VASGSLDIESLRGDDRSSEDLRKHLLTIKGVGNYVASTLLMLLGRYDYLGVDTVFREFVSRKYFNSSRPTDDEAQAIYDDWGRWKYLAYWYDIWSDDGG
jgi:3-methyladenine DNA glycosylase/8-oxoguanine DNA glycosylase